MNPLAEEPIELPLLVFDSGGKTFAMDALWVESIAPWRPITPLPAPVHGVLGVLLDDGEVVVVLGPPLLAPPLLASPLPAPPVPDHLAPDHPVPAPPAPDHPVPDHLVPAHSDEGDLRRVVICQSESGVRLGLPVQSPREVGHVRLTGVLETSGPEVVEAKGWGGVLVQSSHGPLRLLEPDALCQQLLCRALPGGVDGI